MNTTTLAYQSGFGNEFASEAVAGALPQGRNSPQRAPHALYTELLSGTAFTAPRADNRRVWMYRRQPSAVAGHYHPYAQPLWTTGAAGNTGDGIVAGMAVGATVGFMEDAWWGPTIFKAGRPWFALAS